MAEGLARAGFDLDLKFGEARETAFVAALTDCHVECKSDQKVRSTGNVFIETHQHGRPSGINVTTSQWWAIEYADDCWLVVRTALLKALAKRAPVKDGGDHNNYRGRLVPVRWLMTPWQDTDS